MDAGVLEEHVRKVITSALDEDLAHEDITSRSCIDAEDIMRAQLILKQRARVAGLLFLPWIFEGRISSFQLHAQDGMDYEAGTVLATLEGNALSILSLERSLLNLIQHTCGVATLTAQFVEKVKEYSCAIVDTRKTLPGLRAIQKYAVLAGGGKNHRFDLKERVLIKNNHLRHLSRTIENPISTAIRQARLKSDGALVEVEVETLKMLKEALDESPDAILLDNMSPECVAQAVELAQRKVYLEASGGITLSNARAYAETGVDAISIGALTHSAPAVDISLRI